MYTLTHFPKPDRGASAVPLSAVPANSASSANRTDLAQPSGIRLGERRGRDLNPRRTQKPETVFETAAFDRSATPPRERRWYREGVSRECGRSARACARP